MKITDERIKELRELCEKATDAPWRITEKLSGSENHKGFNLWHTNRHGDTAWLGELSPQNNQNGDPSVEGRATVEFIAAARTALPDLLDDLEEARKALRQYGCHDGGCSTWRGDTTLCDCGLTTALREALK